jgi:exoribonuclease R
MKQYKIIIEDRNYTNWEICDAMTHEIVNIDINPCKLKLFNHDVFTYDENNNSCNIIHSIVKNSIQIPGVLILDGSMYGKHKNKYIYKCIPDDKHLPIFLIPYEEKNIGFSKKKINKYITFQYTLWEKNHPEAIIKNNIGSVDELNNFYEYQLFCKSINASIQGFGKDARKAINKISSKKTFHDIENNSNIKRRDDYIFSIDGNNTQDFDDAFSVNIKDDITILSIYITNVAVWMDVTNLWSSFSERISSIYLPDRKRPMLPTILSNILCSLYKGQDRIALVMDIYLKDNDIEKVEYNNCIINVSENFYYDEIDTSNKHYINLKKAANIIFDKYKLTKHVDNSKDIVAYLMMFMNYYTSTIFVQHNCGIYRSLTSSQCEVPISLPKKLRKFIQIWNSSSGQYTLDALNSHDLLKFDSYIHITSPMRRLIDLLNIISIQKIYGLYTFSNDVDKFYEKWISKIDYINTTTRSIRKIQLDCNLLHWCNSQEDLNVKTFEGYVFDKLEKADDLFQYIVYISEINMASKITTRENINNYTKCIFSLHIFNKKDSFKRKVRLNLISVSD